MQRAIRQRCGFGCVVCGLPLYEHEHMFGWDVARGHIAEEITLLCDQHHREKTGGLLPLDAVIAANANPYNLQAGVSKPYDLHYTGAECEALVGGNRFSTADAGYGTIMVPVSIDGVPLLGFVLGDGHLLLNLNLFDESNSLILQISNNALAYRPLPWDIELVGRTLTVRQAHRQILVEITFDPPNRIVVSRGRFLCNGVEVLVRPDHLLITNNAILLSGCAAVNCAGGLIIGPHPPGLSGFMAIDSVPRYLGDRSETIRWAKDMLADTATSR